MSDVRRTEDQPHDRLTELAGVMVAALESEEATEDVQAFVLLSDGDQAGAVIHGYDDKNEMLTHLISHVQAIFSAYGLSVTVHAIDEPSDPRMN